MRRIRIPVPMRSTCIQVETWESFGIRKWKKIIIQNTKVVHMKSLRHSKHEAIHRRTSERMNAIEGSIHSFIRMYRLRTNALHQQ